MTNTELAQTFYKAFDINQPDLLDDVLTQDWQAVPSVAGSPGGLMGQKGTVQYLHSIFQDLGYKVIEIIEAKDPNTIVTRAQLSGVQVGEFLGVKPTNRKMVMETIEIHKIANGKIHTTHHIEDFFGAYQQLTK